MLSIDLFNSRYERKLQEGAVDDTIAHLIEPLSQRAMDIRTQLRSRRLDPAQVAKLEQEYEDLVQKRLDIILDRKTQTQEQQVPSKQDPFAYVKTEPKGIGDLQDPRQKMAQLAQKSKKGPLANVGAGLKAFIKGEPEPMDEEEQAINPRALGVANFQRLVKANMGNIPTVSLEFIRPEENFKLDQKGLDLISDYYDSLENDQAKNYFIYRVLPSGDETKKVLKQLGWTTQQVQPSLPGISTQGELPLQEKKKSNNDDLEAGDVKVARELQKLRAEYPAARSDLEAVARAEIDSTERSRQQLSSIRGANEKQDVLLKQLVDLDQEQGREINTLDKENDSLEQRLAQVQATNDRLQQAVGTMASVKKAVAKPQNTVSQGSVDLAQGGIIDVGDPVAPAPKATSTVKSKPTTSPALGSMAQQLGDFSNVIPIRSIRSPQATTDTEPESQPAPASMRRAAESKIKEHGGGIGPRKHWQSMMQEGAVKRALDDYKISTDTEFFDKYKMTKREFYDQVINAGKTKKPFKAPQACPQCGKAHESCVCESTGMYETALNPNNPKDDYEAKRRALHDLSLNKGVDQAAVLQRRLDLDREAKAKGITETVVDVKAGMADIYRRLAPKIERHRDSFLAGQLYDELENYAELHGAEREFKQMMNGARNRAHMEYDTNPGGFHNWFWFLPFADDNMTEGTDDVKKRMSKLEALALAANRAGNDAKCKMYQQKIQALKQKLSQSMTESSKPGEYYVHTVYFKDGTKKRVRVTSDEFDVADYYTKRGQAVDRVDYDFQLHSDMTEQSGQPGTTIPLKSVIQGFTVFYNPKTRSVSITRGGDSEEAAIEQARISQPTMLAFRSAVDRMINKIEDEQGITEAEKEPTTRQELLNRVDKIQRMMTQERNPANLQIMRKELEMLKQRYQHLKEDSNSGEAVEMAIMRRMLVAHTDLIVEFGLDKVVDAIEEVAYNVGDVDEIGTSDVSAYVQQVKQILGVDA